MSFRVFAHWVRSWLRVRGSRSPHLFPICSEAGGGSMSPWSPLLRSSKACFQLLVVVACPSCSCAGLGVSRFNVVLLHFIVCSLYVYFIYLYYACPSLNCPMVLCFWTCGMASGWIPTGFPPRLTGHCHLVLTGSHDSLFLWYPAINVVWFGPVFLALGSLNHPARRPLSHGRCELSPYPGRPVCPY